MTKEPTHDCNFPLRQFINKEFPCMKSTCVQILSRRLCYVE
ncbi:hypothetical protein KC19_9G127200 [Ceratodon purpureus]|uniref:Uncharacterized protein n=1 Tax=Ceratodon purpureus TaxID=3225 RepID=A0A8T0GUH7_CERPU|nr:hypothetical protein KC19_9G127200 [Ceratodon purpureus]